ELADQAYFHRVTFVTAANNMPVPSFPSVYASVISVACNEEKDPYRFFYNPEPPVEFGAPGIEVRVPWLEKGYLTATGNSYACPHIPGICAKILGKHPGLTPFQLKTVLWATAYNVRHTREELGPSVAELAAAEAAAAEAAAQANAGEGGGQGQGETV